MVLVNPSSTDYNMSLSRKEYVKIIKKFAASSKIEKKDGTSCSNGPLSALIFYIYKKWSEQAKSDKISEFISWLETAQGSSDDAHLALDSLDGVLLSAIHEFEEIEDEQTDLEVYLGNLWKQTFSS